MLSRLSTLWRTCKTALEDSSTENSGLRTQRDMLLATLVEAEKEYEKMGKDWQAMGRELRGALRGHRAASPSPRSSRGRLQGRASLALPAARTGSTSGRCRATSVQMGRSSATLPAYAALEAEAAAERRARSSQATGEERQQQFRLRSLPSYSLQQRLASAGGSALGGAGSISRGGGGGGAGPAAAPSSQLSARRSLPVAPASPRKSELSFNHGSPVGLDEANAAMEGKDARSPKRPPAGRLPAAPILDKPFAGGLASGLPGGAVDLAASTAAPSTATFGGFHEGSTVDSSVGWAKRFSQDLSSDATASATSASSSTPVAMAPPLFSRASLAASGVCQDAPALVSEPMVGVWRSSLELPQLPAPPAPLVTNGTLVAASRVPSHMGLLGAVTQMRCSSTVTSSTTHAPSASSELDVDEENRRRNSAFSFAKSEADELQALSSALPCMGQKAPRTHPKRSAVKEAQGVPAVVTGAFAAADGQALGADLPSRGLPSSLPAAPDPNHKALLDSVLGNVATLEEQLVKLSRRCEARPRTG